MRGFRLPKQDVAAEPAIGAPVGLHGLLALQEAVGTPRQQLAAQDQEALDQANGILVSLGRLQRARLGGQTDDAGQISDALRRMPQASNPELAALLWAVRLRAEVELARPQSRV